MTQHFISIFFVFTLIMFLDNINVGQAATYCMPNDSCWPKTEEWQSLSQSVEGRLFQAGAAEYKAATEMKAPNWDEDEGHGNNSTLPAYAVVVNNPDDVIAAVKFASKYRIRLSVKSTGHDYNGRSTAYGALLVYLHQYKQITWYDEFDDGCGNSAPAVITKGGVQWWDLYPEFGTRGVLSTGGNALTVSVSGGYMLGGGHGAMAPVIGLAADNLMAAEVVTADGKLHAVSACKEPELFRALRGGGAGFGVVISATHKLHPAPPVTVGLDAFYPLESPNIQGFIETYINLYSQMAPHWGGYFLAAPPYGFVLHVLYLGNSYDEAASTVAPLQSWMQAHKAIGMNFRLVNHTSFWDWHGNTTDKTGTPFWGISRLIPKSNFESPAAVSQLAKLLLTTAQQGIGFQCDSTVGGIVSKLDPTGNETAVAPWMRNAVWHIFMYNGWAVTATSAHQQEIVTKMSAKQAELRQLAPISGSYWNEADYYESDWQTSFWGGSAQYNRLLAVKKKYDPQQLFTCHHCVGDEDA